MRKQGTCRAGVVGTAAAAEAVGVSRVALLYLARGAGVQPVGRVINNRFTFTFTHEQIALLKDRMSGGRKGGHDGTPR